MSPLANGSIVARYEVLGRIASGGMSDVYLVRQAQSSSFNKVMVLKAVQPQLAEDDQFLRMFDNEAKLAAVLNHPNVVQVFDFGQDGDIHFMVMEYIDGPSLSRIQKQLERTGERMPLPIALRVVSDACGALEYAHSLTDTSGQPLQIIHRDVSLDNIMLTYAGQVKLVDFGIAKARIIESQTAHGVLRGKFHYMAPEMVAGQTPDRRVDVWAAGVVLYRLLLGVMPFEGQNHAELLNRIVNTPLLPPRNTHPDLPEPLERILMRALARNPHERYASAGEMQAELEEYQAHHQQVALPFHVARFLGELFPAGSDKHRASYQQLVGALTPASTSRPRPEEMDAVATVITAPPPEPDELAALPTRIVAQAPQDELASAPTRIARRTRGNEDAPTSVSDSVPTLIGGPPTPPETGLFHAEGPEPTAAVAQTRSLPLVLLAAALVLVGGVALALFYPRTPDPSPTAAPDTGPLAAASPLRPTDLSAADTAVRVLDAGPDLGAAADAAVRRDQATVRLRTRPPATHGRLRILARPWARVTLDGRVIGTTPMPPLRLRAGAHRLVLENDQLETRRVITVQVQPGKEAVVKVRMDR